MKGKKEYNEKIWPKVRPKTSKNPLKKSSLKATPHFDFPCLVHNKSDQGQEDQVHFDPSILRCSCKNKERIVRFGENKTVENSRQNSMESIKPLKSLSDFSLSDKQQKKSPKKGKMS